MKNTVEGIKSRLDEAEDQIWELEDKVEKTPRKSKEKIKRLKKNEEGLRELQDNMKHNNICIIGIPEGEGEGQWIENLFEKVMIENFPNFMREEVIQVQEAQKAPVKMNPKTLTSRHLIIKIAKFKDKGRILTAPRQKHEAT